MTVLPEPKPTAPAAGQAANPLTDAVIEAAVENAIHEARRLGTTPQVIIGSAPPVQQPGRAAMSSKAVDDTARMIGASVLVTTLGGSGTALLWASGLANPTVVALVFGAPAALALAIGRVLKRAKEAAPDEIHNHYTGPVYQDQSETHTENKGVWVKTNNQQ
jgi:1-aminocyclopropane-1-carboxylate deaminase/D-cysteine desulfhydrase-like pyridoxal-dependent ACC family enzyme